MSKGQGSTNKTGIKPIVSMIFKIFILLIPALNIIVSFMWGFTSKNIQTRTLGRIAFGLYLSTAVFIALYAYVEIVINMMMATVIQAR